MTCFVEGCNRPARSRGQCDMHYQRTWKAANPEKVKKYQRDWRLRNPEKMKENDAKSIERRKTTEGKKTVQAIYHRWYRHSPAMTMWHSAKNRARKEILFTITPDDIVVPTHCPVLGIPIFIGKKDDGTIHLHSIGYALNGVM